MPHIAIASEQTQLGSARNPLGHPDVPLVRIQPPHVHLDLLPKVLSQQQVHLSRWGVPTHCTYLADGQQSVEPIHLDEQTLGHTRYDRRWHRAVFAARPLKRARSQQLLPE